MIDSRLLDAYVAELEALRTHGREIAQAHPDIAGRLDIGPRRSRDPQVERLVESAAFIAARLRLMIEDTASELPLATLSMLAPAFLEPIPSMALLEFDSGAEEQIIPRGARFDYLVGGHALLCFSTTMETTVAPIRLRLRRLEPAGAAADGIGIGIVGQPTRNLMFCLGNDDLSAAALMDAFADALVGIEIVAPGGEAYSVPVARLRLHGFARDEAVLPVRPAVHPAHRLVAEFIAVPEKFRFVSLVGPAVAPGTELRFRFSRPLPLSPRLPSDLITVNRVPGVNLWQSAATPIDIDGRRLEFPVRVDALRYRTVECHSVENVDLFGPDGGAPIRIDPVVSFGNVRGTQIRWGTRRSVSRAGAEVLLYFQGLDYSELGRQRFMVAPVVLASNRDMAQYAIVHAPLHSVEGGIGDWQATLATAPTSYRARAMNATAMESLVGYLKSSMSGLANDGSGRALRSYLKQFSATQDASWIDGIGAIGLQRIAALRGGQPQPGVAITIDYDGAGHRTTSSAMVKRVLGELFESHRGLNRVEEVVVQST